ncbi:HEAT repeat-containing protein 3 [Exaiptasia diaphana]|uniref:SYO1-like TPR repeats domain-containing protein n=1 Tax=Exaiptasia diaphana TaxID=2652724 RepID=A0A913XAF9_EXADI|nr:HEAT repeat-containing protein 3 [Exaiptasia diaphana]KXJ13577.1 HEAT repeat-containing protein 3 [Exaiptasia diaphana]
MGKTKTKKRGKHRMQPMGQLEDGSTAENGNSMDNFGGRTIPLLQKLCSPAPEEKECACAGLANLVFEPGAVPVLIKQDVVRRLGPLLIDSNRSIQEAAAGALRNLSLSGGADVCAKMVEQDVMTPLTTFIIQSLESLQSDCDKPTTDYKKQTIILVIQAINLLWNVCESSAIAVDIFNMKGILPYLVQCLETDIYPMSLAMPAAQCLHTVTEDNPSAAQALCGSSSLMKTIEKALVTEPSTSEVMLLKVLSAGILYNVRYSIPMCSFNELVQAVVKVLSQVLEIDCLEMLGKMMPELDKVDEVQMLLNAQQLALEILSNVCCADEGGDESDWEDISDLRSDTSDEGTDGEDDIQSNDHEMNTSLSAEMINAIVTQQVPKKVLDKAVFGDVKIYEQLNQHNDGQKSLRSLSVVQIRAFICLNNITTSMDVELLGGTDALGQLWSTLFSLTYGNECCKYLAEREDFLEAAAGVMRSVLEKLSTVNAPQYITADQVTLLCQTASTTNCDAVKVKVLSILGYIGKMAASRDDSLEVLKSLGLVLRDIITSQTSLWIISEALDAVFDTFADGPLVNSVMCSIGLLTTLQQLVPILKARVKSEKRSLGDHYPVVEASKTNLTRFIKYKSKGH